MRENPKRVDMIMKSRLKIPTKISIGFETNGKGYLGYIAELPGSFVRGRTEEEALTKVDTEVESYLKWLRIRPKINYDVVVIQRHTSSLMVEDADTEILLDLDRGSVKEKDFNELLNLVWYSGETFFKLYTNASFKDWLDNTRVRRTFYGDNPRNIDAIFTHVNSCQYYYLSRTKIAFDSQEKDFMKIRGYCLEKLTELYRMNNNLLLFEIDNELWTLKKILRRFIWHDRIHGKAIIRILAKQKHLGMISKYVDPFQFSME